MTAAREEILNKLKSSVHPVPEPPDFEQPVFPPVSFPLEQTFKQQLEAINGKVCIFQSDAALFSKLKELLQQFQPENIFCSEPELSDYLFQNQIEVNQYTGPDNLLLAGITGCEFLVAQTGSVMVSSAQAGGRQLNIYPPTHIVIARRSQLVATLEDAYSEILQKYSAGLPSQIVLVTGPSRTADIEKTLVLGAHGPREIWVLIAD